MASVGIGMTTRNRPSILEACLIHMSAYSVPQADFRFVVVDDASDPDCMERNKSLARFFDMPYIYSPDRLGVAGAKNVCLSYLMDFSDLEDLFLFDDDCWPKVRSWHRDWLDTTRAHKVHHSLYNMLFSHMTILAKKTVQNRYLICWNHCLGVALHFTRNAIWRLGSFDTSGPSRYGYEHAQMSKRAEKAGLTLPGYAFVSPLDCRDLLYSVDVNWNWYHIPPPLVPHLIENFESSVTEEEKNLAEKNSILMETNRVYIPLSHPIKR